MLSKISLASVCGLIVLLLAISVRSEQNANFIKCRENMEEQARNLNLSQLRSCFNTSKLAKAKNFTNVLEALVHSLPKQCEQPNSSNLQDCLSRSLAYVENHAQEVKESIPEGIAALVDGARGCVNFGTRQPKTQSSNRNRQWNMAPLVNDL